LPTPFHITQPLSPKDITSRYYPGIGSVSSLRRGSRTPHARIASSQDPTYSHTIGACIQRWRKGARRVPRPFIFLFSVLARQRASSGTGSDTSERPFWGSSTYGPAGCQLFLNSRHSQHPPILNTGNKGPIEHQPGDWVCKKCSYLNWRRRRVCQTCYPCEYFIIVVCAVILRKFMKMLRVTVTQFQLQFRPTASSDSAKLSPRLYLPPSLLFKPPLHICTYSARGIAT
jgi:hypothetical protein